MSQLNNKYETCGRGTGPPAPHTVVWRSAGWGAAGGSEPFAAGDGAASQQAQGSAPAGARAHPVGDWGAAGGSEPFAAAAVGGQDAADGSGACRTSSGQGSGPDPVARQQRRRAGDPPGSPELDPRQLGPALRAHAQPARKRLRKRGPSPPGPGAAAAGEAAGLTSPPSLEHGRQAGSGSPAGAQPSGRPAKPTLEGAGTVAKPKPQEDQQQPAPARRRRLVKRRSSAAEVVAAADKAAEEQAVAGEQLQAGRATPGPGGAGSDADVRAAGGEAAGGDADMRAAGGEAAGGDADMRGAGPDAAGGDADMRAAGPDAAGGDADMRGAGPDAAEATRGPGTGTAGPMRQQSSAKRDSASLTPAAADAEDRAQAGGGVPGPQQPAKRKRLTRRGDPADVAAVGAGQAAGRAGQAGPAGAGVTGRPRSTAGAEAGAAAEGGGAAAERTSLVS